MDLTQLFGSNVFNDQSMRERLPKETYKSLRESIRRGLPLQPEIANVVANAMKDWAIEKGATHYTHWFQPLTGSTAEKHDSFISPTESGSVIMEFSGKQLIQGEPDASSFPSGGIRATFEARGYTVWDCTSPAFLKQDSAGNVTLCIPTAFTSYTGEALDKKTPLLRSMEAVSKQSLRVLQALGNKTSQRVASTVGPEQEYFLVDQKFFLDRPDLILCGRTLFGAPAPKGQELEDQYFGSIKDRVSSFMKDLDTELWKMGITSKTKHNEVAPSQFEMAPIFSSSNIAADHNQLVMETMKKVALRHGLVCLLHEKPYAGINGSGKHNNWSLSTDDGLNLLEPGKTPHENEQFLLFLSAVVKAVDTHADILRAAAANAGNEHRLGANEAPPAIISIFLGEELEQILTKIAKGEKAGSADAAFIKLGVDVIPTIPKDNTDRNRTSPFAFTGNKFEFRMVGSSASISGPNVTLNTIMSEALDYVATRLENAKDKNAEAQAIVRDIFNQHGRVVFNGNNYSEEWVSEAAKRGLPNTPGTVAALEAFVTPKALKLFSKYQILSERELHSRFEIYAEQYAKQIHIEAQTMLHMANRLYLPAIIRYAAELSDSYTSILDAGITSKTVKSRLDQITNVLDKAQTQVNQLADVAEKTSAIADVAKRGITYRDAVMPAMAALRESIDALEQIVDREHWPVPGYLELLHIL